jgi:hypothetical protein
MFGLQNAYATGTINICRICIRDGTHANGAKQAVDGTVNPLGVANQASRVRPDPDISAADATALDKAAIAGENISIFGRGAVGVSVFCNAAWNPGDPIMADANGLGIVATSGNYYVGFAETSGTVNALCPVTVDPGLLH